MFYTFPLRKLSSEAKITLNNLKHYKMYPILNSKDHEKEKCIAYDSYFKVMRAKSEVFHLDIDDDDAEYEAENENEHFKTQ